MGKALINQLLPSLEKMEWPTNPAATLTGHTAYKISLDEIDSYHGNPKTLASGLRALQTSDSQPYAFAGVAYALVVASRESDGSYDPTGLEQALIWLEKAQALEPDNPDINVIEAFIYIFSGRLDDARLVLDYLQAQDPHNYFIRRAELAYWLARKETTEALNWCKRAMDAADNVPQRLRLQGTLGRLQLIHNQLEDALATLQQAAHFDPENAQIWHDLSVANFRKQNYKQAAYFNEKALALQDFPAAREMRSALQKKGYGRKGVTGWLLGQ